MYGNKGTQIYIDTHVLEMVTIFSFRSAWEADTEIISFHGGERHNAFCPAKRDQRETRVVLSRKCWESRLLPVRWPRGLRWSSKSELSSPRRGQCWDAAKPDCSYPAPT